MRYIRWPKLLILLPFLLGFSHIPEGANETILNEALQGQTLIFNRQYSEADAHFRAMEKKYPDSPLPSFGLMALINSKMFENFDFSLDKDFEAEQKRNQIILEKIVKDANSTAFDLFICGASSGLSGFYYARKDKMFAALGEAGQAKKCLERAQKRDPLLIDVDLGFGLFNYWRSVFTSRFKFLPFFKDRRKEGIAQIQTAIDRGIVVGDLARAALAFVYHEQGNARMGLPLTGQLLERYPQNIIMKNLKGNFLSQLGKTPEAIQVLDAVLREAPENKIARYYKGLAYYRAGDFTQAQTQLADFLAQNPSPAWEAYARYLLGLMALKENRRQEALEQFKKGSRVYGDYSPNLKMILKMRRGER